MKLELWLDESDGANGGTWKKLQELDDNGTTSASAARRASNGVDPAAKLTAAPTREGSEIGKPNISVYFRSDGVAKTAALQKGQRARDRRDAVAKPARKHRRRRARPYGSAFPREPLRLSWRR